VTFWSFFLGASQPECNNIQSFLFSAETKNEWVLSPTGLSLESIYEIEGDAILLDSRRGVEEHSNLL
jgi:hypothetical protein